MLKELRQAAGLIQTDVAKQLGISNSTYCLKENGKRAIRLCEAKKLSELFGCNMEKIYEAVKEGRNG